MGSKEWKFTDASSFCVKVTDGTHNSPKKQDFGKPLITSKHIKGRSIDFENAYFICERDFQEINLRSKVDQWDVLISMIGEYCGYCYVERNPIINYAVKNVGIFKTGSKIKAEWLYYFLSSPTGKNILASQKSGTSQPYISLGSLRALPILIPENEKEMESIVNILMSLDEKIELNRQTNATLEAIAQAVFKEWFVDFNYPGATGEMIESELGLIPKGWRVARLGEVSDLSWGDTTTTKNSYTTQGYIAYSASGPDGYLPYYDFSRDGIVVSAIGAYSGKTWLAQGNWSCIKNTIRFWSTNDNLSNEFLYLITSTKEFWPLRGSAQPFISQTDARGKKIIFPGNHLAKYFGEVLQPFFQLIRRNNEVAFTLSQTRDSLLPKLMSGEVEV